MPSQTGLITESRSQVKAGPRTVFKKVLTALKMILTPVHQFLMRVPIQPKIGLKIEVHSHLSAGAIVFFQKPTSAAKTGLTVLFHQYLTSAPMREKTAAKTPRSHCRTGAT